MAKLLEYKHSSYIDQEAVGDLQKELKTYSVVAKSISDVEARLRELGSADAKEAAKIRQIRSNLLAAITSFLKLTQEPVLTADLSSHVNPAYDALEAIRKSLKPMDEKPWDDYYTSAEALTTALVGIVETSTDPQVPVGTLRQAYDTFMHSYSGAITDIKDYLKVTYSTEGGNPFILSPTQNHSSRPRKLTFSFFLFLTKQVRVVPLEAELCQKMVLEPRVNLAKKERQMST